MEEIQLNLELWVKLSAGRWKNITSIPKAGLVRNPSCSCQGRAPCLHKRNCTKAVQLEMPQAQNTDVEGEHS